MDKVNPPPTITKENQKDDFIEFLRLTIPSSKWNEFDKYIHFRMFQEALELIREGSTVNKPTGFKQAFQMPKEYDRHNRG